MRLHSPLRIATFCCLLGCTSYALAADENAEAQDTAAQSAQQGASSRVEPNLNQEIAADIAKSFSDSFTEVLILTALDQEFDSYYIASDDAEPTGSILFFPDDRNHSDWPITLHPLRTELPRYNWQTLVITQPAITLPALAPIEDTEQPQEQTASSEVIDAPQTAQAQDDESPAAPAATPDSQALTTESSDSESTTEPEIPSLNEVVLARAAAATLHLKEEADLLVITGIGRGATWAVAYAAGISESDIENTRLVLINPQQSDDISAPVLGDELAKLKVDTIDIFSDLSQDQARMRKRIANRSDIENYTQVKAPEYAWQRLGNQWLSKKVRGILKVQIEDQLAEEEAKKKEQMKAPEKSNQRPGSTT